MTPTRPVVSRKAISRSPSSISRIGGPSRSSSRDIAAGSQYCRINSPIKVPGPTRVRASPSLLLVMPSSSCPDRKAEPGAGAGRRAPARHVMRPFEAKGLDGAAETDPVADLGTAGIELFARQRAERRAVLAGERGDDGAIERLVDDEMAEPARGENADFERLRIGLDGGAQGLPEPVAAPRRRLIGRKIGVDDKRHDRHRRFAHQAAVDKAEGVALARARRQRVRSGDIELALAQRR